MNPPGELDDPGRKVLAPANRDSHARPVWSTWDMSLMVRAGLAGRKGGVREILDDRHLAEDAFQATFLVLARKARSIRDSDRLGNWLVNVRDKGVQVRKDFTFHPGETVDLGDILIDNPK